MKTAFIFAGQGSQYAGMGKELASHFKEAMDVFDQAQEVLDFDIKELCFEDKNARLNQTQYTQPAILTVSIAALRAIENQIQADLVAGLSLGEYSALVAGGALDFKDAVSLVRKRGQFMEEAVPQGTGGMRAVLGLSGEEVDAVIATIEDGIVEVANYNCPGQIVIGGEIKALNSAEEKLKEAGAKRVIPLSVSGPFHTSILKGAAEKLRKELEKVTFTEPTIPIISNVNADYADIKEIREILTKQVMSSVYWEQSIRKMLEDGVDTFVELGPGKVLTGFIKKIDRNVTVCNVEDISSLEKTLELLGR
ncbi:MAG TPA: ACP S-malonyltransferase [Defluviitaleaceae bacterium]|nr:ACP S-malonyltransferase [Defluviitaleaceae bacterium]